MMQLFAVAFMVGVVAGLFFIGLLVVGAIKKERDKRLTKKEEQNE